MVPNSARKIMRGLAESQARALDPFERAKTFLGRKGFVVFKLSTQMPGVDGYVVGRRTVPDRDSVMALASRLGWER